MDPFEMQKKLFEEWEKNLGKYLEDTMRRPEFMKLVGQNLEVGMNLQSAVKGQVQKSLKALAIPTEKELASLYKTVNSLETRLLDMEEQVEDLQDELARAEAKAAAAPSNPAPRKAPTKKRSAARKPAKKAAKKAAKAPARKKAVKKPAKKASAKKAPAKRTRKARA